MEEKLMSLHKILPLVSPDAGLREVAETMLNNNSDLVLVGKEGEKPKGYISYKSIIRELLNGDDKAKVTAKDIAVLIKAGDKMEFTGGMNTIVDFLCSNRELPLFISENDKVTGRFSFEGVIDRLAKLHNEERQKRIDIEELIEHILDVMPLGIALVTADGEIRRMNMLAETIIKENLMSSDDIKAMIRNNYNKVFISAGESYYRFFTVSVNSQDMDCMVIFIDATKEYNLVKRYRNAREEAETALAIMLPDQRIETRLRSIVEYMDEYDNETGKIKITGIIENGAYKHVINMLKLIADAFKQGLMELPGMDKNMIVRATVLHDIAKVQPTLKVGDLVNPKEVFEQGYLHAFRGASLAKKVYNVSDNVYYLIKYHHHNEKELPDDFPDYLLPMFRFFRLIDGLSAGITRRGSNVNMKVKDTRIYVEENSNFPLYNRRLEIDLYSGEYISERL